MGNVQTAEVMALPPEMQRLCESLAAKWGVIPDIHPQDFIFQNLWTYPGFESKDKALEVYFDDGANSAQRPPHPVLLGRSAQVRLAFGSGVIGCGFFTTSPSYSAQALSLAGWATQEDTPPGLYLHTFSSYLGIEVTSDGV